MLYLGTPSEPEIRAVMGAGRLGCMTTPAQGARIPDCALYDHARLGHLSKISLQASTAMRCGPISPPSQVGSP